MNIYRLILSGAALLIGANTWADHNAQGAYYDYAKVVDVDPIITRRYVTTPREECHLETTTYREESRRHRHSAGPVLLGSLIGGVVGHQFGDGGSRKVLTAAGALLGGTIAHQATRRDSTRYEYRPRTERHCVVVEEVNEVEQIDGYNVTYRYKGNTFTRRTESRPGNRIRIRVEVTPTLANVSSDRSLPVFRFHSSTIG